MVTIKINNVITKQDLNDLKSNIVQEVLVALNLKLENRYLAKKETCKYLKISNNTLDKWILQGLPVLRINGVLRFDRIAIDKWLDERV
ncbi:helix-turn-helix domain-containing protein [Enterococcus devriesei]|uniref:helix-turn-helix domain-containing protein n=1 Tax=Enterococcus devriesei TaxID=319970 RepID=UPI00288E3C79|nr:helix-turn-helix domain-containing protein [Enterococcus devriesei]MDT2822966.1 helix-turn-helix domain-containing protein [Enterococcus devriesei]